MDGFQHRFASIVNGVAIADSNHVILTRNVGPAKTVTAIVSVDAITDGAQADIPLQAGDTIKARCHPLRDGSRGCLLGFLKAPDGSVKDWDGNNLPIPTDF